MKHIFLLFFLTLNVLFANLAENTTQQNIIVDDFFLIGLSIALMIVAIFLLKDNILLKKEKYHYNKQMKKFKNVFEYASDGVHIMDLEGNIIDCSKSFCKLLGYEYDEAKKLNVFNLDYYLKNNKNTDYFEKALTRNVTFETKHIKKDGSLIDVEVSGQTILINNETYIYASARDITKRIKLQNELNEINKDLENRIKKATKKLSYSIEIIENSIIASKTDLNGKITEVTDKFCEISKFSKDELIGNNHNIVRHPDMPKEVYTDLWKTIKSGKTWKERIKNKNKLGEAYWVDSTISPLYDENGEHIGYFSYRIDVTEEIKNLELQKSYNEQLRIQVNEQLEEIRQKDLQMLEQAKMASMGEMLNNIAHQWRQPLNIISVCAGGLECSMDFGKLTKEDLKENIDYIIDNCKYLTKTIETFSNYVSGTKEIKNTTIENEILTAKTIIESSLLGNNIKFIDKVDYSKEHKITIIENEISQVIISIINNAEDILNNKTDLEEKWIKISSQIEDKKFILTLEDNGGGIDNDIISKVFEPYFTTKFKSQGTGLGLSMAYNIIKNSIKGNIYVKNSEFGAKFYLEIPFE